MVRLALTTLSLIVLVGCAAELPKRNSIEEQQGGGDSRIQTDSAAYHSLTGWLKPVEFYVESAAPDAVTEAAIAASVSWGDAIGREVLVFKGISTSSRGKDLYASLDDSVTYVYFESDWENSTQKSATTLATTVWENAEESDEIVKGDVILNAETYYFYDANTKVPKNVNSTTVVDAQTVLLHEFGHLLGLDHISEEIDAESIMHPKTFIGPNFTFRNLSSGDVHNIQTLYH